MWKERSEGGEDRGRGGMGRSRQTCLAGEESCPRADQREGGVLSLCRGTEIQRILGDAQGTGKEHGTHLGTAGAPVQCLKQLEMGWWRR